MRRVQVHTAGGSRWSARRRTSVASSRAVTCSNRATAASSIASKPIGRWYGESRKRPGCRERAGPDQRPICVQGYQAV